MAENIFADEWLECLEAHYIHVIRVKDHVTEPSLTIVMHSAGFNDSQLAELRVRATMHVDDVGADFVPDLDILESGDHAEAAAEVAEAPIYNIPIDIVPPAAEPPPPAEAEVVTVEDETPLDAIEPEIVEVVEEVVDDEEPSEPEPPPDPDAPQQLSMF